MVCVCGALKGRVTSAPSGVGEDVVMAVGC